VDSYGDRRPAVRGCEASTEEAPTTARLSRSIAGGVSIVGVIGSVSRAGVGPHKVSTAIKVDR
jgi:hypothetical protein